MPSIEPYKDPSFPERFLRWIEHLRGALARVPDFVEGEGSPEGNVSARLGTRYLDRTGANSSWLFVKTTPKGNTGWIAYATEKGGEPAGTVKMWWGSIESIPTGWVLCDGNNGTPDLRDRFPIGAGDTFSPGDTGGNSQHSTNSAGSHDHGGTNSGGQHSHSDNFSVNNHTLSTSRMPSHRHNPVSQGSHAGSQTDSAYANGLGTIDSNQFMSMSFTGGSNSHGHGLSGSVNSGGSHSHSIDSDGSHSHQVNTMPPYYALVFIMKT